MQQPEQLLQTRLASAREAQADAMTRFLHARARLAQLEARHHALLASASHATSPLAPDDAVIVAAGPTPDAAVVPIASELASAEIIADGAPDAPAPRKLDDDETEKHPAIRLPRPPTPSAQPEPSPDETAHLSRAEILAARQAREASSQSY